MEHTGIYNNPLLALLPTLSASIWVERAVHIKQGLGLSRGKTDKVDAKRIAVFAYKNRQGRLCGRSALVDSTTGRIGSIGSVDRPTGSPSQGYQSPQHALNSFPGFSL